ncbi:MAG: hypothetical protein ABSH11_04595 [Verrucomicrobiota bacterium]|jgi:flagellar motor switch/type III secretory pathway protein FliN
MSAIKRFWRYWCGNFETAKGGFDISALIVTVMLAASCVLCKLVNFHGPINGFIANYKLADGCEMAAIIVFLGWCFLWLPFRSHEAQQKAHKAEKRILISQVQQAEALFNTVAEHKDKPAEAAGPKQKIKDSLGAYLGQLEDRILAIKKMTLLEYNKSLQDEEDKESIDLLNEIYFFLDLNLGKTESAYFKSRTGITFASVNDWGQSAFKAEKWQGMIDSLDHYASQLKQIIEKQD